MCNCHCCKYNYQCEEKKKWTIPVLHIPRACMYSNLPYHLLSEKIKPATSLIFEDITETELHKIQEALNTLSRYDVRYFQEN